MPWQRYVVDVALEIDPDTGRLVYDEIDLTVPRQSGKTTLQLPVIAHRATAWRETDQFGKVVPQRIGSTAQTAKDARSKWEEDFLPLLDRSPLRSHVAKVLKTNGSERVRWKNGSLWEVLPPTETGGHGKTLHVAMVDEAFAFQDARVEQALRPTMTTVLDPQFWVVSTAGRPESSPYLWGKVEAGRARFEAAVTSSVAYFEWSAPEDADPGSEATWRACMPALGHTVTVERIRGFYESMGEPEFRRAFLNQWFAPATATAIPASAWQACTDRASKLDGSPVFAVDIPPDRAGASIAVAGLRADGRIHVEVVERRDGTVWAAERVVELVARHGGRVVLDGASPAVSLLLDLPGASVASAADQAQACGRLYDAVVNGQVRHLGQGDLDAAIAGASKRPLGDRWAWSRRSSAVDISPLVAVTLAAWGVAALPESGVPSLW
jgi:hypothetical protein